MVPIYATTTFLQLSEHLHDMILLLIKAVFHLPCMAPTLAIPGGVIKMMIIMWWVSLTNVWDESSELVKVGEPFRGDAQFPYTAIELLRTLIGEVLLGRLGLVQKEQ